MGYTVMMKPHPIKRILVIYKSTKYPYPRYSLPHSQPSRKRTGYFVDPSHKEHPKSLAHILKILKKFPVTVRAKNRRAVASASGYDLVISVGGDGTFLKSSHIVDHELLIGVNSSPKYSVGALCSMTSSDFARLIPRILNGQCRVQALSRLDIRVNSRALPVKALNDVLFANAIPAATSRYIISVGGKKEMQKSSGVWIATPSGSTAAIRAAGGKKMPRQVGPIQYLVREPYAGRRKYRLTRGILPPPASLSITNEMPDAALFIDGIQYIHPLNWKDRVRIKASLKPLRVIMCNRAE